MNLNLRGACNAPIEFFSAHFLCVKKRAKLTMNMISNPFFKETRDVTAKDMQIQRELVFL